MKELSVTWRPTYQDARIIGLDEHSTDHAEMQRVLVDMRLWREADRRKQARLHAVS